MRNEEQKGVTNACSFGPRKEATWVAKLSSAYDGTTAAGLVFPLARHETLCHLIGMRALPEPTSCVFHIFVGPAGFCTFLNLPLWEGERAPPF